MRSWLFFLCTLFSIPTALHAAQNAADVERYSAYIYADVGINADGQIEQFAFTRGNSNLPETIQTRLERLVRETRFVPATLDGQPSASRTSLILQLSLLPDQHSDRGGSVLSLVRIKASPRQTNIDPPRYPGESLRRGESGKVVVSVAINAQGRVTHAEVVEGSDASSRLKTAALSNAKKAQFNVERVGDQGVATRAVLPYTFQIGSGRTRSAGVSVTLEGGKKLYMSRDSPTDEPTFDESIVKLTQEFPATVL